MDCYASLAGIFMRYDGMAESVHFTIKRWQTSQAAEPLSRAGKLTVT